MPLPFFAPPSHFPLATGTEGVPPPTTPPPPASAEPPLCCPWADFSSRDTCCCRTARSFVKVCTFARKSSMVALAMLVSDRRSRAASRRSCPARRSFCSSSSSRDICTVSMPSSSSWAWSSSLASSWTPDPRACAAERRAFSALFFSISFLTLMVILFSFPSLVCATAAIFFSSSAEAFN